MSSITQDDFITKVKEKIKEVDEVALFYIVKDLGMRIRNVESISMRCLKVFIALSQCGVIEPNAGLIRFFLGLSPSRTFNQPYTSLHILGDYHILVKLRRPGISTWRLHPFL